MTIRKHKFSILTLALAFLVSLGALIGLNFTSAKAEALIKQSTIFTASGQASVIAYKTSETDGEGEETEAYYSMFSLAFGADSVAYRKNLAYHWYTADGEGFYNMTIGFASTAFERFVIKYDSSQYNLTKDKKTTNYVIFYPSDMEGKVYVTVTDDGDTALDTQNFEQIDRDRITIKFTGKVAGGYAVYVGNDATATEGTYEFGNVGGNYVKNSTSSSNPVAPITFKAEFADEDADDRAPAKMVLYSLNGQSFKLTDTEYSEEGDYYYGGSLTDNCPPVLCLDEDVRYFEVNGKIDFDYAVIDVLRSSPTGVKYYYVLTSDQYNNNGDDAIEDYNDSGLFTELSSSNDFTFEVGKSGFYYPENLTVPFDNEDFAAEMLVKVCVKLTDATSNGESTFAYLDWYISDEYKINVTSASNTAKNGDFIAVAADKVGASYNTNGIDGKTWEQVKADYQAKIDALAENLSAGSLSYLYLPSAEELFGDNVTSYTDLKFSIYYYHNSQSSNTGLASSNLSIPLTKDGNYTFTIYVTDAAGNDMYYVDENGERVEFAASEIWTMYEDEDDEGLKDRLPWFSFKVGYTGVAFDKTPGLQATAYVGTSYSSATFSINGISGEYTTYYRLFRFNASAYAADNNGETLTYEEYVEKLDVLFDDLDSRAKYFEEIPALADMEETDDEYELYSDYAFSHSSTSFTPQDDNAYYLIRAELTDNRFGIPVTCNMGIAASVKSSTLKGESDWLKNNVASVVLLAIAGVSLIGIVLLLVIKPKDKEDIDVEFEKANKKKSK